MRILPCVTPVFWLFVLVSGCRMTTAPEASKTEGSIALASTVKRIWEVQEGSVIPPRRVLKPDYPYLDLPYGDPSGATVTALIEGPQGSWSVPCFWDQRVQMQPARSGAEAYGFSGPPRWAFRFSASTEGQYTVSIQYRDAEGSLNLGSAQWQVGGRQGRGPLKTSPIDPRTFVDGLGETFIPLAEGGLEFTPTIGSVWNPVRAYRERVASQAAKGANVARIWDQNDNDGIALEGAFPFWTPRVANSYTGMAVSNQESHQGKRSVHWPGPSGIRSTYGYYQDVAVSPSTNYRLSGWVKTAGMSNAKVALSAGAESSYQPTFPRADRIAEWSGPTNDWTRITVKFRTDPGEVALGIFAGVIVANPASLGEVWIDDVELVPENEEQPWNLLPDPGFERQFRSWDAGNDPSDLATPREEGTWFNPVSAFVEDELLKAANDAGLYLQLCSHAYVSGTWPRRFSAVDTASGQGIWSDAEFLGYWMRNYRYRVARFSAFPNVMAWEVWNEHGNIDRLATPELWQFYDTLAQFIRSIDPVDRFVTTSLGSECVSADFWANGPLSLPQYHDYITTDYTQRGIAFAYEDDVQFITTQARSLVSQWPLDRPRKPYLWAEIGILTGWNYDHPQGTTGVGAQVSRHNFLWSALLSPLMTTPIDWSPVDKSSTLGALTKFLDGEPWSTPRYQAYRSSSLDLLPGGVKANTPEESLISTGSPLVRALSLQSTRGPGRILAWVTHAQNTWLRRARGNLPEAVADTWISFPQVESGSWHYSWLNTTTGEWGTEGVVEAASGRLTIMLPTTLGGSGVYDLALRVWK